MPGFTTMVSFAARLENEQKIAKRKAIRGIGKYFMMG